MMAFAQFGIGDPRVDQVGAYVAGGLTFTAPFPSRARDEVGLAVASARNGSHFISANAASGAPASGETVIELTYQALFGPSLALQPDLQYVINPGGTHTLRNALAPGMRVAVSH